MQTNGRIVDDASETGTEWNGKNRSWRDESDSVGKHHRVQTIFASFCLRSELKLSFSVRIE